METAENGLRPVKKIKIQCLRGIAVLSVVLFHAAESIFPNGWIGVDLFFTISGYVVVSQLVEIKNRKIQIGKAKINGYTSFLIRRLFRLVPALAITITAFTFLMFVLTAPKTYQNFIQQAFLSLAGLGNYGAVSISGNYFFPEPNPFIHTWSLSVEEQIYIFLGAVFYLQRRITKRSSAKIIGITGLISLCLFATLQALNVITDHQFGIINEINFYAPSQRIWEFCVGALAYFAQEKFKSNRIINYKISYICFVLIVIITFSQMFSQEFFTLVLSVNLLSFLFLTDQRDFYRFRVVIILSYFGDRSYSIYLLHMPFFFIAKFSPIFSNGRDTKTIRIICLFVIFILAECLYRWIENRYRIGSNTNYVAKKHLLKVLVVSFLIPILALSTMSTSLKISDFAYNKNPMQPADPSESLKTCDKNQLFNYCYISKSDSPRVVLLIGDSHARYMAKTFLQIAREQDFSGIVMTKSGCQFVTGEFSRSSNLKDLYTSYSTKKFGDEKSCFQHNEAIKNFVSTVPNLTILAVYRSSSMVQVDFGISPEVYVPVMLNSLHSLADVRKKLVILGPNPEFPDGKRFFSGNTLFWQDKYETPERYSLPRKYMVSNPFLDYEILKKYSAGKNIKIVNGTMDFCDVEICTRYSGKKWLYANSDHLSFDGTKMLKSRIASAIAE